MVIRSILKKNKKGAFELSISVMIIVVLAITLLIMGLVLLRNIFGGATESIDTLSSKVKDEINKIFTDEGKKIVIYLGQDKTAKIKANTQNFGIAIGAKTSTGAKVQSRSDLQYRLELDQTSSTNCVRILGVAQTESLFVQKMGDWNDMLEFQGDSALDIVQLTVPEGTPLCTQKVLVTVRDKTVNTGGDIVGGDFFIIQIVRSGVFG